MQTCPCNVMVMLCIYHVMLLNLGSWEPAGMKWRMRIWNRPQVRAGKQVGGKLGLVSTLSGLDWNS